MKKTSREKLLDVTFEEVYSLGYCGAGTATILKKAGVPKGSMYHHFSSKKEMVLAMIEERLVPKVRQFFDFEMQKSSSALDVLEYTLAKMAKNRMLILHGCPLHRLMFEMGSLDKDIAHACEVEFHHLSAGLARLLEFGMKEGSVREGDAQVMAEFVISSTWGLLSRPIASSSSQQFLDDTELLLKAIKRS